LENWEPKRVFDAAGVTSEAFLASGKPSPSVGPAPCYPRIPTGGGRSTGGGLEGRARGHATHASSPPSSTVEGPTSSWSSGTAGPSRFAPGWSAVRRTAGPTPGSPWPRSTSRRRGCSPVGSRPPRARCWSGTTTGRGPIGHNRCCRKSLCQRSLGEFIAEGEDDNKNRGDFCRPEVVPGMEFTSSF
jgi:hypothetical protein